MKYIREYKDHEEKECVIIMGLPASGKTTLANKIKKENPEKNYQLFDDFQRIKSLEFTGKIDMIISNSMLIEHGLDEYKKLCKERNSKLRVIWFENNLDQCIKNMESRWYKMSNEDKIINKHQDPKSLISELLKFSKMYKIPYNAEVIPVYKMS